MKDDVLMAQAEDLVEAWNELCNGEAYDVVALAILIFTTEFLVEIAPDKEEALKGLDGLGKDIAAALREYYSESPLN